MVASSSSDTARKVGAFEPLREPVFRRIWTASLLSNFGQLILGVGVAWEMTRLTSSPGMVALVQTALMLPLMLVAVPAGAIADMFDRRRVAMIGLAISMLFGAILTTLAWAGLATPWVLLAFCFLIGAGVALYAPSWQASIGEQVVPEHLPAAVALGTISYNLARSFGPALGGVIVLAAGAKAAFAINAVCYAPLLFAYLIWRRRHIPSRLPPERIDRAIVAGARYVLYAGSIRVVLIRAFLFGMAGATTTALAPLIAKTMLGGDAGTYGIMLGSSGVGAVVGALTINRFRERLGTEISTRLLAAVSGVALVVIGLSHSLALTCAMLGIAGGANIVTIALFNISVQLSAPRWVTARALSLFSSALTGGIAFGAWVWGSVAGEWSLSGAIVTSGVMLLAMPLVARLLPLPEVSQADVALVELTNTPEVALALTPRSGPVVIEIDYDVDPADAREFYGAMLKVQRVRLRNGAFGWSISRDIADSAGWTERYQCQTWGDYLRMRARFTQTDHTAQEHANSFDRRAPADRHVRRRLERPFGSVRWRADSPDPQQQTLGYIAP
ncbi:MFS transporter [Sphingomonas solaris]|uniref:MFS transporter n=1 Tax=Alterirhizorhabdus solaris TaxID=2529389 RepID=A0A558RDD2_9SPHN|nr:MFS transporter [Sphingomonas solaris]TVV77232.1 MFS transporter [Sphingomonas solaris]